MQARNSKISKWLKNSATFIFFSINVVALALMGLSALAWYVSPHKSVMIAYLGMAFPAFLFTNLFFLLLWLLLGKWKQFVTVLAVLLLCWKPVFTYFPVNFGSGQASDKRVKLLAYNIHGFAQKWAENLEDNELFHYLDKTDADIVCLEEFVCRLDEEQTRQLLAKRFPRYPYQHLYSFRSSRPFYGIVCLSKFPLTNAIKVPIQANGNGAVLLSLSVFDKSVSLLVNHLQSIRLTREDKESYRKMIKNSSTTTVENAVDNLSFKMAPAFKQRATQADIETSLLENETSDVKIVCGDFNDTPISYTYHKLRGKMKDAFCESGSGIGVTYNEKWFWVRIDYILHSDNVRATDFTIDKVEFSDHYPVWCYLNF
jgi:endonuclease/exonuclease/phosphatase family metal-dependent hydrolase